MVVFVAAYWQILSVVRRQKRAAGRQRIVAVSGEPVGETSLEDVRANNVGPSEENGQRDGDDSGTVESAAGRGESTGQTGSKTLSRAQINVAKTMIYITVCFILCWMPMYLYYLLSTFKASNIDCFLTLLY